MILYIEALTDNKDAVIDSLDVFMDRTWRNINWDETDIYRTQTGMVQRCKGVLFDEEYANGKINSLYSMRRIDAIVDSEDESPVIITSLLFEDVLNGTRQSHRIVRLSENLMVSIKGIVLNNIK